MGLHYAVLAVTGLMTRLIVSLTELSRKTSSGVIGRYK